MEILAKLHIITGVIALAAGAVVFLNRKGNRKHRRIGWLYASSMGILNVSALLLYRLTGSFTPFHVGAIISLIALAGGLLTLRRKPTPGRVRAHALWLAGSYVGLCGAAAAEITTRVPKSPFWIMAGVTSAGVMALGALLIHRFAPKALLPFETR